MKDFFETPDHTNEFDISDVQSTNNIVMALTYILPFLPLITYRDSRYAKFHANQGILCWIVGIVLSVASRVVCSILSIVPLVNFFLPYVVSTLVRVVILAFFVIGIFNALNERAKELPFIGGYKILKY